MATEKNKMFNQKIAALKARTTQEAARQFSQALASGQVKTVSVGGPIVRAVRAVA